MEENTKFFNNFLEIENVLWKAYYSNESLEESISLLNEIKKIVPADYYECEFRQILKYDDWGKKLKEKDAERLLQILRIRTVFIAKHYRNFSRFFVNTPFSQNIDIITHCFYVAQCEDRYCITALYKWENNVLYRIHGKNYSKLPQLLNQVIYHPVVDPDQKEIKKVVQSNFGEFKFTSNIRYYENGAVKEGLITDTTININEIKLDLCNGIELYPNGNLRRAGNRNNIEICIGQNTIELGRCVAPDQDILFSPKGDIIFALTAKESKITVGKNVINLKRRTNVQFYPSGTFRCGELFGENTININIKSVKTAEKFISFYESGMIQQVSPLVETTWSVGNLTLNHQPGLPLFFYESGQIMSMVLNNSETFEYAGSTVTFSCGTFLFFSEQNELVAVSFKEPFTECFYQGKPVLIKNDGGITTQLSLVYGNYQKKDIHAILNRFLWHHQIMGGPFVDFVFSPNLICQGFLRLDPEKLHDGVEWTECIIAFKTNIDNEFEYNDILYRCKADVWVEFDRNGKLISGADPLI